ncbi:cytochrome P450 oxidoreductase [Phlyctema vagabunda]|uniref:Cytochrome P450 oxidoreductase n=1 Tax=Phlyctema vagabunda TaxID=108571 RepID=A0ABR4P299_9HELO
MATAIMYSVAVVVTLLTAYFFPSFHHKNLLRLLYDVQRRVVGKEEPVMERDEIWSDVISENLSQFASNWWIDDDIYQLERRAIFSKEWLFVTHASRFRKAGDYRTFDIAGFHFLLILGKDKQIRAFHNVCRHRAYTITRKESGSSTVLGCRYHGWSYDTKGKLVKAPEFDGVEGFDRELNSLWEIRAEVRDSLVFVNFDASEEIQSLDTDNNSKALEGWKVGELEWTTGWQVNAACNWKLADGELSQPEEEASTPTLWQSIVSQWQGTGTKEIKISPSATLRLLPTGQVLSIRIMPQSAFSATIQCDVYAQTAKSTKSLQRERQLYQESMERRVKELEDRQQELLAGEDGFARAPQDEFSRLLKAHLKTERQLGAEIQPAARKQSFTQDGRADDALCAELESDRVCKAHRNGLLEW